MGKGYCETHYRRLKRHGVAEHDRFDRWGHATSHPLYESYYWFRRNGSLIPEWFDFWAFAAGVGERPTAKHRLVRLRPSEAMGPSNFTWQAPKLDVPVTTKMGAAEYARAYRAANPQLYKDQYLKKRFNMSLSDYQERLEIQGGVCAICEEPETAIHSKTGLPRDLAVDHCHGKGHVRALLCSKCNTGLGSFRDNPSLLRAAAVYLERHAKLA